MYDHHHFDHIAIGEIIKSRKSGLLSGKLADEHFRKQKPE